jgi:hypothetical protein
MLIGFAAHSISFAPDGKQRGADDLLQGRADIHAFRHADRMEPNHATAETARLR